MTIDKSGSGYSLAATAAGAASGASASFDVTAGAAAQLAFIVQPSSPFQGSAIAPAVQVSARDAFGNTVTGFGGSVTIAIGANPSSGALSGTTMIAGTGFFWLSDLKFLAEMGLLLSLLMTFNKFGALIAVPALGVTPLKR